MFLRKTYKDLKRNATERVRSFREDEENNGCVQQPADMAANSGWEQNSEENTGIQMRQTVSANPVHEKEV